MSESMIYGRRLLLAKENLKVKNYLIENPLPQQPLQLPRNPCTPHNPSRHVFMTVGPLFTAELLRVYGAVREDSESMDDPDHVRDIAQFLRGHDLDNWPAPMNTCEEHSQPSRQSIRVCCCGLVSLELL